MAAKNKKTILISGGSRGLGQGMVKHFLENTAHNVVTFSREASPFIRKMQKKYAKRLIYRALDIRSGKDLEALMAEADRKFGQLDVLINNAGIAAEGVLPVFAEDQIDKVIDINLKSTIRLSRLAARRMIQQSSGVILNISSIIGLRGYAGLSVYAATKAALDGFTRSLARELGRRNIRVNSIAPGYLLTEMSSALSKGQKDQIVRRTPLGRLGEVGDVVSLADYLISDRAAFLTGQVFVVDGGITC